MNSISLLVVDFILAVLACGTGGWVDRLQAKSYRVGQLREYISSDIDYIIVLAGYENYPDVRLNNGFSLT